MNLGDQLEKIQRFLRDPQNRIWSHSFLVNLFNDAQKDLQNRTEFLEDIKVLSLPPIYQWSYLFDWEWKYMDGSKFHQALKYHEQGDFVFCHIFEPQVDYGYSSDATDNGAYFTHPWEAWAGLVVGTSVKVSFPENFHSVQFLAYDRKPLTYVRRKDVITNNTSYMTYEGLPRFYYKEDELENSFVPYPKPSTVVWNDVVEQTIPDYIFTQDWEEGYLVGNGENWTRTDSTNSREYVFNWELEISLLNDFKFRGMYIFERSFSSSGEFGFIIYLEDVEDDNPVGTIEKIEGSLFDSEDGAVVEYLDDESNFLLVYDINPTDLSSNSDESDFPPFMRKYLEHKVISRAYGANTDGKIQSLSDYWEYRFQTDLEFIKRFMSNRRNDRDYRLVTKEVGAKYSRRLPKLPSTYPAT